MIRDFKEFALRGNLLELAVAFVLGTAFAAVVTSFINDIVMNVIAAIVGKSDSSNLTFKLGNGVIRYGSFLTALVTFLLIAVVLFAIVRAGDAQEGDQPRLSSLPHTHPHRGGHLRVLHQGSSSASRVAGVPARRAHAPTVRPRAFTGLGRRS